jgi:hypothetical protein
MKINELSGIKDHPAYQAVKSVPDIQPGYAITDSGSAEHVDAELAKLGWSRIGSGTYGLVYRHPQKNYVLKVFAEDYNYLDWLNYVQQNQTNPHVPRLYGKPRKIGNMYAIRMEILTPLTIATLKKYIDPSADLDSIPNTVGAYESYVFGDDNNLQWIETKFPKLHDALMAAYSIGDDLHENENIMQRGSTIVLIDP